jgi:hypothetical protein
MKRLCMAAEKGVRIGFFSSKGLYDENLWNDNLKVSMWYTVNVFARDFYAKALILIFVQ